MVIILGPVYIPSIPLLVGRGLTQVVMVTAIFQTAIPRMKMRVFDSTTLTQLPSLHRNPTDKEPNHSTLSISRSDGMV